MKLYFPTQAAAQLRADEIHAEMVKTSPGYAKSVQDGKTLRWSIPRQDKPEVGKPSDWYIVVRDRCDFALAPVEKTALVPFDKRSDGTPVKVEPAPTPKPTVAPTPKPTAAPAPAKG